MEWRKGDSYKFCQWKIKYVQQESDEKLGLAEKRLQLEGVSTGFHRPLDVEKLFLAIFSSVLIFS